MSMDPLARALGQAGEWTALVGPRGAGKSLFARFVGSFAPAQPHAWSLQSALQATVGELHVRAPKEAFHLDPKTGANRTEPVPPGLRKPDRSRELVLSYAPPHPHRARTFDVAVLDVPGGWGARDTGQRFESVRKVLGRTRRYVLFVPFWALLPRPWLERYALEVLGDRVWATSLGAGALEHADPALVQQAVAIVHAETLAWFEALWTWAPRNAELFVAISQMQSETFVPLLDAFAPELGTGTWAAYDRVLGPAPEPGRLPLHRYAERLASCAAAGSRLLLDVRAAARSHGTWAEDSVCAGLLRVLGRDAGGPLAQQHARAKIRVRSILPLNLIAVRGQGKYDWHQHGRGDELRELRMGEDLLAWLVLDAHAHALWRT